jgi:magnesium transporter
VSEATNAVPAVDALGHNDMEALHALNAEFLRHHPDEVARFLDNRSPNEAATLLEGAPADAGARVLELLNPRIAADVIVHMSDAAARSLLGLMTAARVAPILASFHETAREGQLARVDARVAKEVRELLLYPWDTAGALMDPRISSFGADTTVDEALRKMRTFKEKELDSIYLMAPSGKFAGAVPLGEIATAHPETKLRDLVRGDPITVAATASREEIVEYLKDRRIQALPVLDTDGHLIGVIRYSALVAAAEAEATMSMQTMVGVGKDERALSGVRFAVRQRLPWLQINLLTAFLAASVVGLFEDTIAQYTALAVLLPVVAGQSGNSGMQAMAVTIRGLALREVRVRHWPRLVVKEAGVGIINGFAVALTTMLAVYVWSHSLGLVIVIGLAMVISVIVAGLCGALVPLVLKAAGQDPAQSSSIVLTTFTDCGGFLSFLGLATLFSSLLR